uniref:Uncharacterized protein n=1 Tax=Rhizophora mucronata TaxID=61149 RepID=A0A2P2MD87_RHIMU
MGDEILTGIFKLNISQFDPCLLSNIYKNPIMLPTLFHCT